MQHFDVVVIGREVAGLVAGALLAKSGQRVLHLDLPETRNSYKYKDLTFFRRVRLFSAWDGTPTQKRALFELNLISEVSRRLQPVEPTFQVVYPGHRFDVRKEEAALAQELGREWEGAGDSANGALRRFEEVNARLDRLLDGHQPLPPEKWGERRRLRKFVKANPMPEVGDLFAGGGADSPLARVAALPIPFLSSLDVNADCPARVLRAAARLAGGLYTLPGGLDELADLLAGVIKNHHGASRTEEIEDVEYRWRRIKTLRLRGGDTVGCERLIGAEPAARLFERLPPRLMKRRYARQLERLAPAQRVFTMNLAIRNEGIPEGMGPLGFAVGDPGQPLTEGNLLLWWLSPGPVPAEPELHRRRDKDREKDREKEKERERAREANPNPLRALTLAAVVPNAERRDRAYWQELRARLLRTCEGLMPFSAPHIEHVDVPWDDGDGREGTRPVTEMDELYGWDGDSTLGLTALPHRTPVKNLVLANRQILPGLGLEGEFLAGAGAARLLHNAKDKPSWAEH